jgi:uncharacterized membrane protein
MRPASLVAPVLIAGGVAAVVTAIATGGAQAGIFVVFPVIFGSSALFLVGVLLLIAGIFVLPFAFGASELAADGPGNVSSGGLVLIGPVPIFWGSMGPASRRVRLLAAVAGGLLLVVAAVLFLGWVR